MIDDTDEATQKFKLSMNRIILKSTSQTAAFLTSTSFYTVNQEILVLIKFSTSAHEVVRTHVLVPDIGTVL